MSNDVFSEYVPSGQENENDNLSVPVSYFDNVHDNGGDGFFNDQNDILTWREFGTQLAYMSTQDCKTKEAAPLFAPTTFSRTRGILGHSASGCLVLDSDGVMSIDQAKTAFEQDGLEAMIYSTASHQPNSPRFRVVLPLRELTDQYIPAVNALKDWLAGRTGVANWEIDEGKLNPYSIFYFPGRYACAGEHVIYHVRGVVLTAGEWIEANPQPRPIQQPIRPPASFKLTRDARWDPYATDAWHAYMGTSSGRRGKLFGLMKGLCFGALNSGYDVSANDIADLADEAQRANPPSGRKSQKDWRTLVVEAEHQLDRARMEQDNRADEFHQRQKPYTFDLSTVQSMAAMLRELKENPPPEWEAKPEGQTETENKSSPPRLWPTPEEDRLARPPEWLIRDLLPQDADVFIYGPTGSLKSFLALAIGFGITTGTPVLEMPVVNSGPVFYWCGEGYADVRKIRRVAWEVDHGYEPFSDLGLRIADAVPLITDEEFIARYVAEAQTILGDRRAGAFIVDTMARALNGQEEDRSHVAIRYLNVVQKIRRILGGTSITIGHTGWDPKRSRGSSAYPQGYDTILRMQGKQDPHTLVHTVEITVEKQKGYAGGQTYYAQSRYVSGSEDIRSSLVLDRCDEEIGAEVFNDSEIKPNKGLTTQQVECAIQTLKPHGGLIDNTTELAKTIAQQTDHKEKSVRVLLSAGKKPGLKFAKYWWADKGWCMPGRHMEGYNESHREQLDSLKNGLFTQ
jgi:hypothetical protein